LATLHHWLTRECERLAAEGKSEWADTFDTFAHDLFAPNYTGALAALPILYTTLDFPGGAAWRLVLDYYAANILIYWQGELAHALKTITQATIQARNLTGPEQFLTHYTHEILLHAWLEVDAPGKAKPVLAAADKARAELASPDMIARYDVLRSRCLTQLGRMDEALDVFHGTLAALDWSSAYYLGHRGSIADAAGDLEQAADDYANAIAAFEALGHRIEANGTRIGLGHVQARMGQLDDAIGTLTTALNVAENTINRAHIGMAQGALGRVCRLAGYHAEADEWFDVALGSLNGLGWARYEAEIAVDRVATLKALGKPHGWDDAARIATDRVEALNAADLKAQLADLLSRGDT
jgi:tetratricopeptide (TPR) repeat protein